MSESIKAAREFLLKRYGMSFEDSGIKDGLVKALTDFANEQTADLRNRLEAAELYRQQNLEAFQQSQSRVKDLRNRLEAYEAMEKFLTNVLFFFPKDAETPHIGTNAHISKERGKFFYHASGDLPGEAETFLEALRQLQEATKDE